MPRFFCPAILATGATLELPAGAARHVQVLRLQPGDSITLFNGGWSEAATGGEFDATITRMGRSDVEVLVGQHQAVEREMARRVHLAVGMPANDRMDWLVEKATELGVVSIQPLMTERSVLRLAGERAEKKVSHWQSIAIAACEQCGGNQVPRVRPVRSLASWLATLDKAEPAGLWLLSLRETALTLHQRMVQDEVASVTFLSGPEGGFSSSEENSAFACGFAATQLGARVLRAETAALAALAALSVGG